MSANVTVRFGSGRRASLTVPLGTASSIIDSLARELEKCETGEGLQIVSATLHGPAITEESLALDRLEAFYREARGSGIPSAGGVPWPWRVLMRIYLDHIGYCGIARTPFNVTRAHEEIGYLAEICAQALIQAKLVTEERATYAGTFPRRYIVAPRLLRISDHLAHCIGLLYSTRWHDDVRRHSM